jgi:hypothetical protein
MEAWDAVTDHIIDARAHGEILDERAVPRPS